jgi:hypothetical protein
VLSFASELSAPPLSTSPNIGGMLILPPSRSPRTLNSLHSTAASALLPVCVTAFWCLEYTGFWWNSQMMEIQECGLTQRTQTTPRGALDRESR